MRRATRRRCCAPPRRFSRQGFGLVEVLFAMAVTSIAIIGLGGMLVHSARAATQSSTRSSRAAIEAQQLNRLGALAYDSLDAQAGCVTVSTQPLPHSRCISVTNVGGGMGAKELRLIISPSNASIKPDTTYLTRSKGQPASPLGT